jgi:hypothetical protein
MKNGKTIESAAYTALILNIVGLSSIIGLLLLVSAINTRANLGIPLLDFGSIRIVIILLGVVIALQVGILIYKIKSKEKICPKCQTPLPKWRIPKNGYEALVGGWTCPSCGTKLTWQLHERK